MEARNEQFRSVHVLRHTFRPSEYLSGKLQQFVKHHEGAAPSRFILSSTREVAVDEIDFQNYRYNLELQKLDQQFHRQVGSVALQSVQYNIELDMRRRPQRLTLRFVPSDAARFAALTAPIDDLAGIVDKTARSGEYFAYIQLDARHLVGREALIHARDDLQEGLSNQSTRSLYNIIPHDISGPARTVVKPQGFRYDDLYDMMPGEDYNQLLL